jgi:two-component system, NtrC family, response regulator HupR/HoxA
LSRGIVLFATDDENIISILRSELISEDYECLFAINDKEVIEIIKNNEIGVIIVDKSMQEMDRLTLLKEVSDLSPNTLRIVLIEHSEVQGIIQSNNKMDIFNFIAKPLRSDGKCKIVINQAMDCYKFRKESEALKNVIDSIGATYQNMIRDISYENISNIVEDKIAKVKNESDVIKDTSNSIIEYLFKILNNNISEDKNFDYEFERGFYKIYNDNINSRIDEIDVRKLLDQLTSTIKTYNKNCQVEEEFKFPESYKIKINKAVFDSFLKYIFMFSVNSQDTYNIKINGGINYVVNQEITNFIVNVSDKTNDQFMLSSISSLNPERIEFINTFMNKLLEPCNGSFRINKIQAKLIIEIHLTKKS